MSETASYKKQKEDFVSGLSGGSVAEINYVTSVAVVSACLGFTRWRFGLADFFYRLRSFYGPSSKLVSPSLNRTPP